MPTSYPCPSCQVALTRRQHGAGLSWACAGCGGVALNMSMIRQNADAQLTRTIWSQAQASRAPSPRACPSCGRAFKLFEVQDASATTELDGCVSCAFFWFDSTELTRLGLSLRHLPAARRARAPIEAQRSAPVGDPPVVDVGETIRDLLESLVELLD